MVCAIWDRHIYLVLTWLASAAITYYCSLTGRLKQAYRTFYLIAAQANGISACASYTTARKAFAMILMERNKVV